jgi:hypothetical protein
VKENLTFIIIFVMMMVTIIYLNGCTYLMSENEPMRIACRAKCDAQGNCTSEFKGNGAYMATQREGTLDTPTQTKVGLDN